MRKYIALFIILTLIFPYTLSFSVCADNEVIITTGQEFVDKIVSSGNFKIEGSEDTNGDGEPDGIIIPVTYASLSDFSGKIIGVNGKNNIQISKPLFASFNGTTTIENINLKTDKDGTFAAGSEAGYGALVCSIDTAGTYTFNKVANYCDIKSEISTAYAYLGGLIGKVTAGTLNLSLCSNYGSVTSSARYVGGLIGGLEGDVTFTIDKSFNAGNITGNRNTGGIAGLVTVTSGTISNSFNAGNVITSTGNATNGGAGIAAPGSKCLTVNNVYNVGALSHSGGQTAGVYDIAVSTRVSSSDNCYYIPNPNATGSTAGTEITSDALSTNLPVGFSSDIWEFVTDDGIDNEYVYPQIKGNTLWNDYKYFGINDNVTLEKSSESGVITIESTDWEKVNSAIDKTSVYKDIVSPSVYDISANASYSGVLGLSMLVADKDSKPECTFTINKSAEVYIATDKNPKEETVNIVKDNGFKQVFNSDGETPATVVTKGGAIFYLSKKSYVISGNETTKEVTITGDTSSLGKSYFVLINWLDNSTVTFDLSGNENIYINDELYQNSTYSTVKGGTFKIKIEPKQNYYIKDFVIDDESEKQNIVTYYEKEVDVAGDVTIKSETSSYEFIDEDLNDDIIPPTYQLIQGIENGTGLTIQSIRAEGYLGEFLKDAVVTLNVEKGGSVVAAATGTVNRQGKVQITVPMGNAEGECTLSFKLNASGITSDISIDDSKKTYNVPSVADVNNLISELNNSAVTAQELKALILEEKETLPFNITVFKNLDPAIQNKITSDMVVLDDYSVSNLYTRYDNFVVMNTVNMTTDSQDILKLFDNYVFETGIDFSDLYDDYEALSDKLGVCEGMLGVEYVNAMDILPQFEYAFVKAELNKAINYDVIIGILDDYDEVLGIESLVSQVKAKNINEQKVINEEIGKNLKDLTTKALFEEKLEYVVANSKKILNDKTKPTVPQRPVISGGGGGGGSVSVGNDYLETPVVTPIEDNGTNAFTDLGDVSWASDSITKLFYKGIIKGKEQGKFCPQDKVTRAEFVKMAVEAFNLEIENPVSYFTDLPKDHWAYKYVASASDIGIINGYSATEFGTEGSISRQDMIAVLIRIIYRLSKYEEMENRKNPGVSFTDESEIADYALGGVTMFAGSGIISGYEDGSFRPTNDLTRAEAAVILNNVIEFFRI